MSDPKLENLAAALKEYVNKAVETYKSKLDPSYNLYNSISGSVKEEETNYNAVLTLSEVWKYIEYGRQPGKFPPVDAIRQWIRSKSITPQPYTLSNGKTKVPSENQLAFLIGRKIAREGIKARPYLAETIEALEDELLTKLAIALNKDVTKELKDAFDSK